MVLYGGCSFFKNGDETGNKGEMGVVGVHAICGTLHVGTTQTLHKVTPVVS